MPRLALENMPGRLGVGVGRVRVMKAKLRKKGVAEYFSLLFIRSQSNQQLIPLLKEQLVKREESGPTRDLPSTLGQTFPCHKSSNSSTMNPVCLTRRCVSSHPRPSSFTAPDATLFFVFYQL